MFLPNRTFAIAATLSAVVFVSSACSSSNQLKARPKTSRSVSSQLALIPQSALTSDKPNGSVIVSWVDLDRAGTVAGVARPTAVAEQTSWLSEMRKRPDIALALPTLITDQSPADYDKVAAEIGILPSAVTAALEVMRPPFRFSVLSGDFTEASLTKAMKKPTDRMWSVGPVEDYSFNPADRTPLRKVGEGLRFAMVNGDVMMSTSTTAVRDANSGSEKLFNKSGDLQAIATEFDNEKVFSALIVLGVGQRRAGSPFDRIDEVKARLAASSPMPPIESIGVGLYSTTEAVLVYTHTTSEIAELQEAFLPKVFAQGINEVTGKPLSDVFTVASITRKENVVTVKVTLPTGKIGAPLDLLMAKAVPFGNGAVALPTK
jgi:hypothetical protein